MLSKHLKTGNIVDYVVNELVWFKAQLSHAEAPNGPEDCRAPSVLGAFGGRRARHYSLAHHSIYGLLQPARTAASKFFLLRPFRITCAPSRASASAMAQPIPELDPVTSARRPAILRSIWEPPHGKVGL